MAIAFVGSATATKAGAAAGNTTITLSSGLAGGSRAAVATGDLVVAIFATSSSAVDRTLAITDGTNPYTLIGSELFSSDNKATNLRVAYKFMGGTPDSTVTFGPTGNASDAGSMAVFVFSGVDSSTPLDGVAPTTATGTNAVFANPPSVTPSTAGAYVVSIGAGSNGTGGVFTSSDLTGFVSVTSPDDNDSNLGVGYLAWTSGAFDPAAFGGGGTSNTESSWAAMSIALRPAATGSTGTLTGTEGADSAAFTGDVIVGGTVAATEGTDTAAFAGDVIVQGALSGTDGADAATLAGVVVSVTTGTLAAVEGADVAVFTGDVLIDGTLSGTEGADSSASTGLVITRGALGTLEGADSAAFTGKVIVQGSLSGVEGADSAALSGGAVSEGALAATEGADTAALTGDVIVQGFLSATEGADTSASLGQVITQGAIGSLEGADSAAFTGLVLVRGTLAATDGADSADLGGSAAPGITGTLAATEGADSASIIGPASTQLLGGYNVNVRRAYTRQTNFDARRDISRGTSESVDRAFDRASEGVERDQEPVVDAGVSTVVEPVRVRERIEPKTAVGSHQELSAEVAGQIASILLDGTESSASAISPATAQTVSPRPVLLSVQDDEDAIIALLLAA